MEVMLNVMLDVHTEKIFVGFDFPYSEALIVAVNLDQAHLQSGYPFHVEWGATNTFFYDPYRRPT